MANPIIPTNGTHETQERYPALVLKLLRKANRLRNTAGRDYEGDLKAGAAKITVRDTEVAVGDYDIVAGGSLGTSATTFLDILVNKNKYINELVDGYEALAVPDGIKSQRLISGAFSLEKTSELDFIAELKTAGTESSNVTALINTTVYNSIVTEIGELTKLGIDKRTIRVAITTDIETLLLQDTKYTNTASSVGSERAMSGVVNMIRGAEVFVSDELGLINTTNVVEYLVYSTDYAQAGDEWKVEPQFNDLLDGAHIGSSALQARWIYFNKLTRGVGARIKRDSAT